ncbi:MAG: hypothetical protein RR738_01805 [Anaerorhabdus sp.]
MEKIGYSVTFTAFHGGNLYIIKDGTREKLTQIDYNSKGFLKKLQFYWKYYEAILKYAKINFMTPNLVYARNMFYTFNSRKLLKFFNKNGVEIVMEIPTYPVKSEYKSIKNLILKIILYLQTDLGRLNAKYVDLYAVIGEKCNNYFGRNAVNISNGINVDFSPIKSNSINYKECHLLALATMCKWHGYERVIEGIAEYYKQKRNIRIIFHLVGNDGDGSLNEWALLTKKLCLEDYVVFEGFLKGNQLNKMFDLCDIAIASLGGYKKGLYYASDLKIREYCARGIPFVFSTKDESLLPIAEYIMKISNDNVPLNIEDVLNFYSKIKDNNKITEKLRTFAIENLSWETQFKKILKELESQNNKNP